MKIGETQHLKIVSLETSKYFKKRKSYLQVNEKVIVIYLECNAFLLERENQHQWKSHPSDVFYEINFQNQNSSDHSEFYERNDFN